MLPIKNRLKKKKDFEKVFEKGSTIRNRYFFLRVLANNGENDTRIGFIVSKKVSKRAVERNRIKRLFRESVRLSIDKIRPGYDMIFIVLSGANHKELIEIKKEIDNVLEKSNLINI
ncbi:MAG: ribonuclease P protein component [Candidatus Pacebacteria bacterium]|nr:ribonuclease P protein component [Candidatus Paceibacterota bacterium]